MKSLRITIITILLLLPVVAYGKSVLNRANPFFLQTNLVSWWTLDGDDIITNIKDSSTSGNNMNLTGYSSGTTTIAGMLGQGLVFNGSSQYARNTSPINLPTGATARTVSLWFKTNKLGVKQALVQFGNNGVTRQTFILDISTGNKPEVGTWADDLTSANSIVANKWYHMVATYDSGTTLKLYMNGVLDKNYGLAAALNTTLDSSGVNIGAWKPGSDTNFFSGVIDDVRIYNTNLSTTTIQQLYNAGRATTNITNSLNVVDNLRGWWTLDGKDMRVNALDRSGNSNNGNLTGFVSTTTIGGRLGQALDFDGRTQYVNVTDADSLTPAGSFSLSTWVKVDAYNGNYTMWAGKWLETGNQREYAIGEDTAGSGNIVFFYAADGSFGAGSVSKTTTRPSTGGWHHIVGVFTSASNIELYLDGVSKGQTATTDAALVNGTSPFRLGKSDVFGGAGRYLNGAIDDTRLYNKALTASEVKQLYNQGFNLIHNN